MKKILIAICLGFVLIGFNSCANHGLVGNGCGPATFKKADFKISKVDYSRPINDDYIIFDRTTDRKIDTNGLRKK